jgi:hypothetical protein
LKIFSLNSSIEIFIDIILYQKEERYAENQDFIHFCYMDFCVDLLQARFFQPDDHSDHHTRAFPYTCGVFIEYSDKKLYSDALWSKDRKRKRAFLSRGASLLCRRPVGRHPFRAFMPRFL